MEKKNERDEKERWENKGTRGEREIKRERREEKGEEREREREREREEKKGG